ncbi:MAG: YfhO family protein [Bacteroidales bacterium]
MNFVYNRFTSFHAYLIIAVLAVVAYWDLVLGIHVLKWDMIDANYAFQHLQSLIERNGNIPLWDPYTYLGTPLHTKMGQWYPIRFISSKISEYTLYKLNVEYVLHIILAGSGMFTMARSFSFSRSTALFMGIAYMFCGFFTGNAQHMTWLISGAWLPWVIYLYRNLLYTFSYKKIPFTIFVFFSFFIGGYPAFSIVIVYILCGVFLWKIIDFVRKKQYDVLRQMLLFHLIVGVSLLILASAYFLSFYIMLSSVTRGEGINLATALFSSTKPIHFLTTIVPFILTNTNSNMWACDISMVNNYIGISTLVFGIYSIRFISTKKIACAWIGIIVFVSLALGQDVPVRTFFYEYIPLWNLFRFPALFRLFYIFLLIYVAGYSFEKLKYSVSYTTIRKVLIVFIACYAVVSVIMFYYSSDFPSYTHWHSFISKLSIAQAVLIQTVTQSCILLVLLYVAYALRNKIKTHFFVYIVLAYLMFDMVTVTQLQSAITVSNPIEAYYTQKHVDALPKQTSWPDVHEPAYNHSAKELAVAPPLWKNLQIFHKKRAYNGYTSYVLKSTEIFEQSIIYDSVKKYPVCYFPTNIYHESDTSVRYDQGRIVVFPDTLAHGNYTCDSTMVHLISGNQNGCTLSTYCSDTAYLVIMQNLYPGWKATINSEETNIVQANYSNMAIVIPPGESIVELLYEPAHIGMAYAVYQYSLYILIAILLVVSIPKQYSKTFRYSIVLMYCFVLSYIEVRNVWGFHSPTQVSLDKSSNTMSNQYMITTSSEQYHKNKTDFTADTCEYLSPPTTYGSLFSVKGSHLADLLSTYNALAVSISVLPKTNLEHTYIAISLHKRKHQFQFITYTLQDFITEQSAWNNITIQHPLYLKSSEKYQIKVFIYSPQKNSMYYKNFTISFF